LKRLSETIKNIGQSLEKYELDRASRPILAFIEDLSVWYLRRSRDRFKSENKKDRDYALNTTRIVLVEFSKAIAPFLPFYAEYLYKEAGGKLESVHLETWPNFKVNTEDKLLERMEKTRAITSTALEKRAKANIKTRQPLSKIILKDKTFSDERFLSIIKDEVNVKEIVFDIKLESDLILDTEITEALKEEGTVRDIIRAIQEARKNNSLTIKDVAFVTIDCNLELKNAIEKNKEKIIKSTLTSEIKFENLEGVPTIETDVGPLRIMFSKN
jgi:isoleucyl-tRNA synthetase